TGNVPPSGETPANLVCCDSGWSETARPVSPDHAKHQHGRAGRCHRRRATDVVVAARIRNAVKTAEVEDEAEPVADAQLSQPRDVGVDESRLDSRTLGRRPGVVDRERDEINARRVPPVLGQVDAVRARSAAKIYGLSRTVGFDERDQLWR